MTYLRVPDMDHDIEKHPHIPSQRFAWTTTRINLPLKAITISSSIPMDQYTFQKLRCGFNEAINDFFGTGMFEIDG